MNTCSGHERNANSKKKEKKKKEKKKKKKKKTMARRKSLLELAKRLRHSAGGASSSQSSSPSKSSIKSESRDEDAKMARAVSPAVDKISGKSTDELDENGNVVIRTKEKLRRYSDIGVVINVEPKSQARVSDATQKWHRRRRRRSQQVPLINDEGGRELKVEQDGANYCKALLNSSRPRDVEAPTGSLDERSWNRVSRQLQRMTNQQLESLLNAADDEFVLDCLIDRTPIIKSLERERDEMRKQVLSLANTNYAREPEFVRDRLRLREQNEELARMVRQLESKHMEPILVKLNQVQAGLARDAMKHEELSEKMAHEFLANGSTNNSMGTDPTTSGSSHESFIRNYVELRKETSKKRILADRLAKERDMLLSNITCKSLLISTRKQSKSSTTGSETASINSADSMISSTSGATTTGTSMNSSGAAAIATATTTATTAADVSPSKSASNISSSFLPLNLNESPKPTPRQRKRVSFNK